MSFIRAVLSRQAGSLVTERPGGDGTVESSHAQDPGKAAALTVLVKITHSFTAMVSNPKLPYGSFGYIRTVIVGLVYSSSATLSLGEGIFKVGHCNRIEEFWDSKPGVKVSEVNNSGRVTPPIDCRTDST